MILWRRFYLKDNLIQSTMPYLYCRPSEAYLTYRALWKLESTDWLSSRIMVPVPAPVTTAENEPRVLVYWSSSYPAYWRSTVPTPMLPQRYLLSGFTATIPDRFSSASLDRVNDIWWRCYEALVTHLSPFSWSSLSLSLSSPNNVLSILIYFQTRPLH